MLNNILVFAPCYPPYIGGIANHSQEFASALTLRGVHVTTFAPYFSWFPEPLHNDEGIIWYPGCEPIKNLPSPKIWSKQFWIAWRKLSETKYDCVISRTRFFPSSIMAWIFARRNKIPWIHIEHGSAPVNVRNRAVNFAARLYDAIVGRLIFRTADEVISISRDVQTFVGQYGRQSPCIYRGLNIGEYDAIQPLTDLRRQYPNRHIITWTGRMYQWKGIHLTVQALRILPQNFLNRLVFVIIGEGPERSYLEELSHGLSVVFWGAKPREQVIGLLKESDIFIHSSLPGGGLSTSLLEAMYCKNAVIATPFEGAKEVIFHEKTGLLTKTPNPKFIARYLERLIQDTRLRYQLGNAANKYITEHFSWDRAAEQYLEVFETIMVKRLW